MNIWTNTLLSVIVLNMTCLSQEYGCIHDTASSSICPENKDATLNDLQEKWKLAGTTGFSDDIYAALPQITLDPSMSGSIILASIQSIKTTGGTVFLKNGTYELTEPISIQNYHQTAQNPIRVLGESRDGAIINYTSDVGSYIVHIQASSYVHFENVTIKHGGVETVFNDNPDFFVSKFKNYSKDLVETDNESLMYLPKLRSLDINNSDYILIKRVKILYSGRNPFVVNSSRHVQSQENYIRYSFNKGNETSGYYMISGRTEFFLSLNDTIRDIRHIGFSGSREPGIVVGPMHNVFLDGVTDVDVNFHNGDCGGNLIEGFDILLPETHGWHAVQIGACSVKNQHAPPGYNNLLFRNVVRDATRFGPNYSMMNNILYTMDQPRATNSYDGLWVKKSQFSFNGTSLYTGNKRTKKSQGLIRKSFDSFVCQEIKNDLLMINCLPISISSSSASSLFLLLQIQ